MKTRSGMVLLALLVGGGIGGPIWSADDANVLLKKQMAQKQAIREIDSERAKATNDLQQQFYSYSGQISTLRQPPTEAQVTEMKGRLASLQREVESLQNQLAAVGIKDPAEREAKIKELTEKASGLQKQMMEVSAPFNTKAEEVHKVNTQANVDFSAVLDPLFKELPEEKGAGIKKTKFGWMTNSTGMVQWKDETGKMAVTMALFLEESAAVPAPSQKKIDDKYPYYSGPTNMSIRVGYFQLSVNIQKAELQGDEAKLTALVKSLVDLDALAAMKPE